MVYRDCTYASVMSSAETETLLHVCVCQNVELVNDVQKAILQLQADCEKLQETTNFLHEDNKQKQTHIEVDEQTELCIVFPVL